jgi:hypothetical protein
MGENRLLVRHPLNVALFSADILAARPEELKLNLRSLRKPVL